MLILKFQKKYIYIYTYSNKLTIPKKRVKSFKYIVDAKMSYTLIMVKTQARCKVDFKPTYVLCGCVLTFRHNQRWYETDKRNPNGTKVMSRYQLFLSSILSISVPSTIEK
jgi:hypothetical protein